AERRAWSHWQLSPWMLSTSMSRTPRKLSRRASISICLMTLLMVRGPWPGGPQVPPAGVSQGDRDAGRHGPRQGDRLDVVPLDAGRLDGPDLLDEGGDVGRQPVVVEAHLADAGVDVTALVGAVFHLAGLELADGGGHVLAGRDDRAGLGRGHQAARA